MSKFLRNGKIVAAILVVLLIVVTAAAGVFTLQKVKNHELTPPEHTSSAIDGLLGGGDDTAGPDGTGDGGDSEPGIMNRPDYMKGMTLTAGKDYLTDGRTSAEAIQADLDAAFDAVMELDMNTVLLPLTVDGRTIAQKSGLPYVDDALTVDILEYASQKAREKGLYIYVVYDLFTGVQDGAIVELDQMDSAAIDATTAAALAIAQNYDIEGILFDSYYYEAEPDSYLTYKQNGGGMGYENYMSQMSHTAFKEVSGAIRSGAPGKQVGMFTVAVWANSSTDENGSDTTASYTAKYSGNADNLSFLEEGYVDFVVVKAEGATTDANIPYKTVVAWWGEQADAADVPLYVLHYSSKACSEEAGWTEYDQLALQLIASEDLTGFEGDFYDDLDRFQQDLEGSTTAVLDYYDDTLNRQHILTELAVTSPAQKTYTTFETSVTFMGASDPGAKITINDQEITTDENGYFTLNMPLSEGLNTFVFTHKGKTDVYNITREVQVIRDVSPTGNISVDGGMRITITATAYKDATVYAVIGGQTVQMTMDETGTDEEEYTDSYRLFTGSYTAPAATDSVQDIGNIVVYGTAQGSSDSKTGAYVKVNKRVAVEDGSPIRVVSEQAETFPANTLNDLSDPDYFPLPQGALDYTVGSELVYKSGTKTYTYYKLASGVRVYRDDITGVSDSSAPGGNAVTGIQVASNDRYTDVVFDTGQQVSYSAKYTGSAFTIDFNYTNSVPATQAIDDNPMFDSMSASGTKVTLNLASSGRFMGYRAFYNDNGQLVFRFNNPQGGASGTTIVVDPGHGGTDVGALGFLPDYPEKVITREIAEKVADELESYGANVILLDTEPAEGKYVIQERVAYAKQMNAQIFLSIHCNTSPSNSSAVGTEVYYFNDYSQSLATRLSSAISSALDTTNRGAKFGRYYVTRDPQMVGVLCETGFLTNEREYNKLLSESYQQEIAENIASAVNQYLRSLGGSDGAGDLRSDGNYGAGSSSGSTSGGSDSSDEAEDLALNRNEAELAEGESLTLRAALSPSGASADIVWSSDDEDVATVNQSGKVTAVGEGECVITAETADGDLYDDCVITVTSEGGSVEYGIEEIELSDDKLELSPGEEYEIEAYPYPDDADDLELVFSTSNDSVVDIEDYGDGTCLLIPLKEGRVTITVENPATGVDASITVRVKE